MRKVIGLFAALLSASTMASAEPTQWMGHLTKFTDAKAACGDIYSRSCEPYLAEAVATINVLDKVVTVNHQITTFYTLVCPNGTSRSLNGLSLLHAALSYDQTEAEIYWTDVLYVVATRDFCKR
jgi:hypothetical protein